MAAAACGKSETTTTTFRFTSSSQPGTSVRPARRTPSRQSVANAPFFILACSISRTSIPLSHRIAAHATSTTQEARRHHREEGKSSAVEEATRGESLSDPLPSSERSEPNRTGQRHPRSRSLLVWFRRSPSLAPSVSVSIHLRTRVDVRTDAGQGWRMEGMMHYWTIKSSWIGFQIEKGIRGPGAASWVR